jgi:hypothetical protein
MMAIAIGLLAILLLCGYGRGTEQFIPIGESPGVSGTRSVRGSIAILKPGTMTLCVWRDDATDARDALLCTPYSHAMAVYLDRSHLQRPNTVGSWRDLKVDQTVEIWPEHWIKVRMEE